jgi:hypothetical protein
MIIHLDKKEYYIEGRNLTFDLQCPIDLELENCTYYIIGENGIGKTTFIEKILIPELKNKSISFAYLGQDNEIQIQTIQSSIAIVKGEIVKKDFKGIYDAWLSRMSTIRVLVNDEFDKYLSEKNWVVNRTIGFVKAYFIISHLGFPENGEYIVNKHDVYFLKLSLNSIQNRNKKVNITLEKKCH